MSGIQSAPEDIHEHRHLTETRLHRAGLNGAKLVLRGFREMRSRDLADQRPGCVWRSIPTL